MPGLDRTENGIPEAGGAPDRTALQRHVMDLARGWRRHGCLKAKPRLEDEGFDDALRSVCGPVQATVGPRDFSQFVGALKDRAGDIAVLLDDGNLLHGKLFAIPVFGTGASLREAFREPSTAHLLARSLRTQGLAAPGSNVLLSSMLVSPSSLARCTPERMRLVARHAITVGASGKSFTVPDMNEIVARLLAGIDPAAAPADPDVVSHRVLVGMRTVATPETEDCPRDFFTWFVPPETMESDDEEDGDLLGAEAEEAWTEALGRIVDLSACRLNMPCGFVDAVTTSACNVLDTALAVQGELHRIDPMSAARAVHMTTNEEALLVSFEYEDGVLGPASVPLELVACDPETVSDHALFYARPGTAILQHDNVGTLPRGTVPLH